MQVQDSTDLFGFDLQLSKNDVIQDSDSRSLLTDTTNLFLLHVILFHARKLYPLIFHETIIMDTLLWPSILDHCHGKGVFGQTLIQRGIERIRSLDPCTGHVILPLNTPASVGNENYRSNTWSGNHWCLAWLNIKDKTFTVYDPYGTVRSDVEKTLTIFLNRHLSSGWMSLPSPRTVHQKDSVSCGWHCMVHLCFMLDTHVTKTHPTSTQPDFILEGLEKYLHHMILSFRFITVKETMTSMSAYLKANGMEYVVASVGHNVDPAELSQASTQVSSLESLD
jgi:hypothetical protein